MMDIKKKREIFEKYDFSKTAILKKAGIGDSKDPRIHLYHDIAGMVQALYLNLGELAKGMSEDIDDFNSLQNKIYRCYGWLQTKYLGIDWEALDPDDSDCRIFFKTKDIFNDLGKRIGYFLDKSRIFLSGKEDMDEYKHIEKDIDQIRHLMQEYRKVKKKLHEKLVD
jgi:hypothetical protein